MGGLLTSRRPALTRRRIGGGCYHAGSRELEGMPTPEFIIELREKIGHDLLWLPGVTGLVVDEADRVLTHERRRPAGQGRLAGIATSSDTTRDRLGGSSISSSAPAPPDRQSAPSLIRVLPRR